MADFKQLCRDLMDALDSGIPGTRIQSSPLAERARAALAEPDELMTDHMDDLRQASADVSGVEVLSPAAQAVWDAAWQLSPVNCESHEDRRRQQIAAALRAVAEQVGPSEILPPGYAYSAPAEMWHYEFKLKAKRQILAIADELENNDH